MLLNQFHTVCPKIETKFLGKLGNSKVFLAQNQVVSKKKKKKVFTEIETDFSAKIGNSNVFAGQNQVVSKKKVFTKIQTDFLAKFGNPNVSGGAVFLWGGLFSIFHKKSASKAPTTCDFAYFTNQWGGSSPPPPGYATGYSSANKHQNNFESTLRSTRSLNFGTNLNSLDTTRSSAMSRGDSLFRPSQMSKHDRKIL